MELARKWLRRAENAFRRARLASELPKHPSFKSRASIYQPQPCNDTISIISVQCKAQHCHVSARVSSLYDGSSATANPCNFVHESDAFFLCYRLNAPRCFLGLPRLSVDDSDAVPPYGRRLNQIVAFDKTGTRPPKRLGPPTTARVLGINSVSDEISFLTAVTFQYSG